MPRTPSGQTRARIYEYVRRSLLQGQPPTVREIQEAFGFRSAESARGHLRALVTEGRLLHRPGKSRGYQLPLSERFPGGAPSPVPTALVPMLGRVQAGMLTTAVEEPDGYLPVHTRRPADELFALRAEGESMIEAGILPGDVVIVRRQSQANTGDIVVAVVGDEATIKRLYIRNRRLELHPENPAFDPIVPDPKSLFLLGKVIEIRRYLETREVPFVDREFVE